MIFPPKTYFLFQSRWKDQALSNTTRWPPIHYWHRRVWKSDWTGSLLREKSTVQKDEIKKTSQRCSGVTWRPGNTKWLGYQN